MTLIISKRWSRHPHNANRSHRKYDQFDNEHHSTFFIKQAIQWVGWGLGDLRSTTCLAQSETPKIPTVISRRKPRHLHLGLGWFLVSRKKQYLFWYACSQSSWGLLILVFQNGQLQYNRSATSCHSLKNCTHPSIPLIQTAAILIINYRSCSVLDRCKWNSMFSWFKFLLLIIILMSKSRVHPKAT